MSECVRERGGGRDRETENGRERELGGRAAENESEKEKEIAHRMAGRQSFAKRIQAYMKGVIFEWAAMIRTSFARTPITVTCHWVNFPTHAKRVLPPVEPQIEITITMVFFQRGGRDTLLI